MSRTGGLSRTKNQPKEEVFGADIPRTSRGHSRGYPGPKLRSGSKSWKDKRFSADIHDPKARTSTTLRDFQKLRSEKLWAEFSFPSLLPKVVIPPAPKSKAARLQGDFGTKFLLSRADSRHEFSCELLPKIPPKCLSFDLVGPKKSCTIPVKISRRSPSPKGLSLPPFNLDLTPLFLPQFYLLWTSFLSLLTSISPLLRQES